MFEFLVRDHETDYISGVIEEKFNNGDVDGFLLEMLRVLFRAGVIGVKPESYSTVLWSYLGQKLVTSEIGQSTTVHVHPAFWSVLGIQDR